MDINTIIESKQQDKIIIEEENKNSEKNILDKFLSDIKKDTCNLKEFWKKHKNTIFWIFVTFVVLQYVDILSLGHNFSNACHKNGIIQKDKQEGGADAPPAAPAPAPAPPAAPAAPKGNNKKDKKKQSKNTGEKKQKKGKQSANKGGKFQSFRTTGPLGNIFGKFGSIFQNAFKIIGVILLIAILGFLPIIVMIYLTYKIIKYMVNSVKRL